MDGIESRENTRHCVFPLPLALKVFDLRSRFREKETDSVGWRKRRNGGSIKSGERTEKTRRKATETTACAAGSFNGGHSPCVCFVQLSLRLCSQQKMRDVYAEEDRFW